MASFFQPDIDGPKVDRADSRFLYLWNSTLKSDQLTLFWYQNLVIAVGCTAFLSGCFNLIFQYARKHRGWRRSRGASALSRLKAFLSSKTSRANRTSPAKQDHCTVASPPKLSSIRSFCVSEEDIRTRRCQVTVDLCIVPLTGERPAEPPQHDLGTSPDETHTTAEYNRTMVEDTRTATESLVSTTRRSTHDSGHNLHPTETQPSSWGSVDHGDDNAVQSSMRDSALSPLQPHQERHPSRRVDPLLYGFTKPIAELKEQNSSAAAAEVNTLRLRQGIRGVVMSYRNEDSSAVINALLQSLREQHVSVILMGAPDVLVLDSIHFGLVDGLIIQNASILTNGERRDFFRASQVRECVARCKRQQKARPEFFLGFLESWSTRPSAATLRRAFKLADFFGAVMQAQATLQDDARLDISLSGFDWLKRPEIIKLQKQWQHGHINVAARTMDSGTAQLDSYGLSHMIGPAESLFTKRPLPSGLSAIQKEDVEVIKSPDFVARALALKRESIWDTTSCGIALCPLGCFSLRDQITQEHYDRILQTQRNLKRLQMLHVYADIEILNMSKALKSILEQSAHPKLLQSLLDQLASGQVRIYKGLDSGLGLPDDGGHMLGLSDFYREEGKERLDIYISLKNSSDAATIWHVFLGHHGIPRLRRFEEEVLLSSKPVLRADTALPKSIMSELEQSTEAELLFIVEQIRLSNNDHRFNKAILEICSAILLEETSRTAWVSLHSKACLDRSLSIRELLEKRLTYFAKYGARYLPELDKLEEFYLLLEGKVENALFNSDRQVLQQLSGFLIDSYNAHLPIDCNLDLYGLMFFCALRRLAFDDVYLETTDRCPLFLQQQDQAGVFSELWVLGSQCEIYFGILPRSLGEITYNRYHKHLTQNPPPTESWNGKDVFTAYSVPQSDVRIEGHGIMSGSGSSTELPGQAPGQKLDEPEVTKSLVEATSQFGALSIFCLPAVIDVLLLSFLGRGLYLSAYMDLDVVLMANYAILTALIMTGGVTGWVGSTGGFYLFSFAFDNMAHFLVQRFSAAFMLTTIVAFCGFFGFGAQRNWWSGFIYVIYLYPLTIFLNLLGMFATMHRLGCPLTSGRIAMWKCIPILFIPAILTTFVNGHDLLIYMLFIYLFVVVLIITFRDLLQEWTTWLAKVPSVKENDLMTWYIEKIKKGNEDLPNEEPSAVAAGARLALVREVHKFEHGSFIQKIFNKSQSTDAFVRKMAVGHPYAIWLLEKEAGGAQLPEIYTTTWFVQLELAFANQRQLMRGLKEHSPFITFRYSKYDLGQNVGLFLGALLDRWIDITMSARSPQIVVYFNNRSRYGICFGLLYFLFGAVAVDTVLARYWPLVGQLPHEKIAGLDQYNDIVKNQSRLRNKHYRSALSELLTLLAINFGILTILLWAFVIDHRSLILYFTYISGYTGVLLFQFHRCFTKNPKAHVVVVLVCCVIGYLVGCLLRAAPLTKGFFYDYVIGLNAGTVPAAILTFLLTGYFEFPFARRKEPRSAGNIEEYDEKNPNKQDHQPSVWQDLFATYKDDLCNLRHETHRKILQHICLKVDVDKKWSKIPEDVRALIVCRLLGAAGRVTAETRTWLSMEHKSIDSCDEGLIDCLESYSSKIPQMWHCETTFRIGSLAAPELTSNLKRKASTGSALLRFPEAVCLAVYDTVKWTALISGAAPDASRELWYALKNHPLRLSCLWILLKVWKICWWMKNLWTYYLLILGKPTLSRMLDLKDYGLPRTLEGNKIMVDTPLWKATGFISRSKEGNLDVAVFEGLHADMPDNKLLQGVAMYDSSYRLAGYEEHSGHTQKQSIRIFQYDNKDWRRWPTTQVTREQSGREIISNYDKYGRVVDGKVFRGDAEFNFQYLYRKRPRGNTEILKAVYTKSSETDTPFTMSVFWSVQPRAGSERVKNWIPSVKIQRVSAALGGKIYEMKWTYKHARDPEIETTVTDLEGFVLPGLNAPACILKDDFGLLKKPQNLSFDQADLLIYHPLRWLTRFPKDIPPKTSTWMSRVFSLLPFAYSATKKKVIYQKLPTSVLRTSLWTSWSKPPYLDAVSACFLDEMILRKEPLLQRYWSLRDAGFLRESADVLDENLDQVISAIEPSTDSSQNCPLIIKATDLFVMGLGKDANQVTARPEDAYHDTHSLTSVIFSDNGCWPDNPGGVSNCRRDLVNGHTTIRGHCLAESANDFGIPRYQIERNINSLKVLPLWGLDGKTPYHGVLDNLLQTQVDERINQTRKNEDIKGIFVPLLKSFVRGARMKCYTRSDLVDFSNVILKLNRYFEKCDFNKTWENKDVWEAWIEAWLFDYNDSNISNTCDFFEIEQASLNDFREALNLYICYFFIYSVELPADCPSVFQSTHHGISSLYGMLLKYRRGTTWGIWDHAILWRETCLNISPAQCLLPIPVQSMLLAGIKLACHLAYTHVDIVLPCTSVFNPDWEIDLGTDQGLRSSKKSFSRKIDPIVNGIGNMDAFKPVTETRSKLPTCVMLSNVQFIKDVKNAVLAADVIVNKYGFSDYRLVVYGAQDRQPSYALETTTLINNRNLNGKVILAGFGSPKEVLKDAWLFMNSSLSEGLPLAIGEAALSGIPIVATEVGATALVLTDPDDSSKRYGEVVPPNDPEALARAQLSILSMLGPWAQYTKDTVKPPPLPDAFKTNDVKWITKRMHEKADDRRALGLRLRDVVLRSFHGTRYLREHEQMYWIQRSWAETRRAQKKLSRHPPANGVFGEQNIFEYDDTVDTGEDVKHRWQDFDHEHFRLGKERDARSYSIGTYEKAVAG